MEKRDFQKCKFSPRVIPIIIVELKNNKNYSSRCLSFCFSCLSVSLSFCVSIFVIKMIQAKSVSWWFLSLSYNSCFLCPNYVLGGNDSAHFSFVFFSTYKCRNLNNWKNIYFLFTLDFKSGIYISWQKDRETARQRDRKNEREKDWKTKRQTHTNIVFQNYGT